MAEHLWFVPVTGGGPTKPTPVGAEVNTPYEFNVQWDVRNYPMDPVGTAIPCVRAFPVNLIAPANQVGLPNTPATLRDCHGKWIWRSCTDGQAITVGGQLAVGTVLSRRLKLFDRPGHETGALLWDTVEAWVKYRVSATVPLTVINFTLNDRAGLWADGWVPTPGNWLGSTVANAWRVIYLKKSGAWTDWIDENLRAVLTVLGTTIPANVGLVEVDVEWFAFRLSDQVA